MREERRKSSELRLRFRALGSFLVLNRGWLSRRGTLTEPEAESKNMHVALRPPEGALAHQLRRRYSTPCVLLRIISGCLPGFPCFSKLAAALFGLRQDAATSFTIEKGAGFRGTFAGTLLVAVPSRPWPDEQFHLRHRMQNSAWFSGMPLRWRSEQQRLTDLPARPWSDGPTKQRRMRPTHKPIALHSGDFDSSKVLLIMGWDSLYERESQHFLGSGLLVPWILGWKDWQCLLLHPARSSCGATPRST